MTGTTHIAIGVGTSLLLLGNSSIGNIIGGVTLAVVGSLMPDIDTQKSKGSKVSTKVIVLCVALVLTYFIISKYTALGGKTVESIIATMAIIATMLAVGMQSKHRGFTHSLTGMVVYSVPVYMFTKELVSWFVVGYMSHIIADMLNIQKVKILYPINKGYSLGLCKSNGTIDKAIRILFTIVIIIRVVV